MSWYVEGRLYHSYPEYQEALATAERRKAERAATELAEENRRLMQDIANDRRAMDEVQGDVRRQMETSRRIQSNIQTVERNQHRLEGVLQNAERRLQDGLSNLEREIAQQGGKLHQVEADVDQLRENHRRHVESVRSSLSAVRTEMAQGLAQAERQRRETEERLKAAVGEVDRKLEHDRAERAKQARDQLALANSEVAVAEEALARIQSQASMLDLAGDIQQVQARLSTARTLVAKQDAASALAVCTLARADAESLVQEAQSRQVEIAEARREMTHRLASVLQSIGPDASQDVKDCYGIECNRIEAAIASARDRLASRYQNYRLLQIEGHQDQELLEQLEGQALDIVASAPVVAEAAQQRVVQLDDAMCALERVYGEMTRSDRGFSQPGDPKSDLLVTAVFGSSKVQLRFALDGTMSVDGYGHGSATECAAAANRVLEELRSRAIVRKQTTDDYARNTPKNESAPRQSPVSNLAKGSS